MSDKMHAKMVEVVDRLRMVRKALQERKELDGGHVWDSLSF